MEAARDFFGSSLSLSSNGNKVVIGGRLNDGYGNVSGHARIYDLSTLLTVEEFSIHLNPTSNFINIELKTTSELKKVTIYNQLGQLISEETKLKIN